MIVAFFVIFSHLTKAQIHYVYSYDQNSNSHPSIELANLAGSRYKCISDVQLKIMEVFEPWLKANSKIVYADPAMTNNIGNVLLWAGSNKLFRKFGKFPSMHCGGVQSKRDSISSCESMEPKIREIVGDGKGFIFYHPGGNWGNVYRHVMESRLRIWKLAFENEIPFVSGPQSVYYQSSSKAAIYDQKFIKMVGTMKDLLTFRQRDSYEFAALQYGNTTTVKECPDMAFMLGAQTPSKAAVFDVFLLMRHDSESQFSTVRMHDDICEGIAEAGFTCGVGDWGAGTDLSKHFFGMEAGPSYADLAVEVATETVSLGELIVTDRLHGAIFAFLTGKPVIYVDNTYDKLSNSISTAFRETSSCSEGSMGLYETSQNVEEIVQYVVKYLKKYGKAVEYEEAGDHEGDFIEHEDQKGKDDKIE